MQRLFSTFANGWPGTGLLLQRLLTGAVLFHSAIAYVEQTTLLASTIHIVGAGAGILLLLGLWTPVAGTIVAVAELCIVISHPGDPRISVMLATLAVSLVMIGPGAWSIDARLFGRKQIEIPKR